MRSLRNTRSYRHERRAVTFNCNSLASIPEVIKKTKENRENMKKSNGGTTNNLADKPGFKSYIDILLDLEETDASFTEERMRGEVNTIILAGQETIATTLFFCFLTIGDHKDVQEKMVKEIKQVMGEEKCDVTKEHLSMMPYCEAVINETMRLYPAAPGVMRYADRDVKLGKRYAIPVLKTILIHCIRDYEIIAERNENLEFKVDVALKAINGHLIQVKRRQ
ncbi:cytochrome P450 4g1-like [Leptidea sinapis]|uniref:cytochrome P450 4g1-like n=1 Tax=Leptidea sinapis TaxID=189913 RepID=UPI0021C36358|nr:cytochrome P450 4g1-like [Leptidea sinapis]